MKRLPSRSLKIAAAGAAAVVLGAGGGVAAYEVASGTATQTVVRQVTVTDSQPAANSSALSVSALYDRVHQGVVTIKVTTSQGQALGSGFVIDGEGHIVTNDHVVEGASAISVEFADGSTYDAQLVGTDASTDIGVIKVNAPSSELTPLELGDSSAVQVGDEVVAIGSPLGLNETVTSGIVSALHRTITSPNNFSINDAIQTDAAINHGNSGGPLLDLQGQSSASIRRSRATRAGTTASASPSRRTPSSRSSRNSSPPVRSSTPTSASASPPSPTPWPPSSACRPAWKSRK